MLEARYKHLTKSLSDKFEERLQILVLMQFIFFN